MAAAANARPVKFTFEIFSLKTIKLTTVATATVPKLLIGKITELPQFKVASAFSKNRNDR